MNIFIYYTYQIAKPLDIILVNQTDFLIEYTNHIYNI